MAHPNHLHKGRDAHRGTETGETCRHSGPFMATVIGARSKATDGETVENYSSTSEAPDGSADTDLQLENE